METFLDYARRKAVVEAYDIDEDNCIVEEHYLPKLTTLINTMKSKVTRLDKLSLPYITDAVDAFLAQSEKQEVDVDIPDSIILRLSKDLIGKPLSKLTNDEAAIVNTLAVYVICK